MNNNEIPIILKTYQLYKTFYTYAELFPKKGRYTLGKKCEKQIINFFELVLMAKSAVKEEKKSAIAQASIKLDMLKIFIRLCQDLKFLDQKKYLTLENNLQEIGRMLGGWQKSL